MRFDLYTAYLSSVLTDTLPQWFEDAVKGLDTVGRGSLRERRQGQGGDGPHLLLLIHQPCRKEQHNQNKSCSSVCVNGLISH